MTFLKGNINKKDTQLRERISHTTYRIPDFGLLL